MKQTSLHNLVLFLFAFIVVTVRAEPTELFALQLAQAKEHLRISEAMQAQMLEEFDKLQASGEASEEELDQFRTYLERINHTVDEQRKALALLMANYAVRSAAESVAPLAPSTPGVELNTSVVETDEERLSKLDRQLDDALSEFDDMLLREQEELASRQSSTGGGGGGGGGGDASQSGSEGESGSGEAGGPSAQEQAKGTETGESASAEQSAESATSGAERVASTSTSGPVGSSSERNTSGTVPPGIPDGRDDDVVARQLREAAENEPDPTLRAKLWEEYRKYKNSGG